ncbi:DUF481 domain-containing protein [Vibrio paucivorans]|uniref:DUF481 domain-containing protein n=1 Tax=Vibrio paucivorans TaxID=2829489 RepID=A0A9X3HUG0_9VIBR|nr:DUF481 domain-containing protein [Vibrio paucivorans]MCW8336594.1 DUF481 domain-containing protein [Vibrio paucivorans]
MKIRTLSPLVLSVISVPAFSADVVDQEKLELEPISKTVNIDHDEGWLQLKSGEVLIGSFTGSVKEDHNSYYQTIEFDSDDLGDQEIDLEDIAILQTASKFRIRLANGETYEGYLRIEDDKLTIIDGAQTKIVPTGQVVTIHNLTTNELERWSSDIFLGANFSKGNTDELSVAAEFNAERTTVYSRTLLKYSGNLTESSGEKTANSHMADGSYDIYLKNQLFFRPIKLTVSSDEFQNIDYQVNASMQIGYFVVTQSDLEWDVSLGPGYQYTRFDTVQEEDSQSESSPTVLFSSNLEYEITSDLDFTHTYDMSWASNAAGGVRHINNLGLDLEVIEDLDFSVKFVWDHVSEPKADEAGIAPEKDDYKLNFGVTYEI